MKQSILFVCLGNICRSPMADAIALHWVKQRGLDLHIDSAGTAAYHTGEPADPRTLAVLKRHNIPYGGRARKVRQEDFERFDLILAMDKENLQNLQRVCAESLRHKLHLVLQPVEPGAEVGDPYYGGDGGFEKVYRQLNEAIEHWLRSAS